MQSTTFKMTVTFPMSLMYAVSVESTINQNSFVELLYGARERKETTIEICPG